MSYLKLLQLAITLIILGLSAEFANASIVEGECDGTIFAVKIVEVPTLSESLYTLYYKTTAKEKKFLYTPSSEHLSLACVQDNTHRNFLLLEERCGGRGRYIHINRSFYKKNTYRI